MSSVQANKPRAAMIDLDGTLLDTLADLAAAANAMRVEMGHPALAEERIREFVGKGADRLVHRALTDNVDGFAEAELFAQGRAIFLRLYDDINGKYTQVYPGVIEGLDRMRAQGLKLACVTNKPKHFADPLLKHMGLSDYFETVIGGECLPQRKPDPAPVLEACRRLGVDPSESISIGDSLNDAQAGRAAGSRVLLVPYGYNEGQPLEGAGADAIVATLLEAAVMIEQWAREGA